MGFPTSVGRRACGVKSAIFSKKIAEKAVSLIFLTFFSLNSYAKCTKLQDNLPFDSDQGRVMLFESNYNNDFFQLVNFYQPQINPVYCSIASSVIVLNALYNGKIPSNKEGEITKPQELGGGVLEFPLNLQSSFFDKKISKIKAQKIVEMAQKDKNGNYDAGVSLADLASMLEKKGLDVKKIYAEENGAKALNNFRRDLKKYLADKDHFILVNFDGKILGTKTGGHVSPLAAYHKKSDSILVLDVALHKNKWYFAPVEKLYEAMHSKDGENFRGYLIVSR